MSALTPEQQRRVLDSAMEMMVRCDPATITLDQLAKASGLSGFDIVRHYHSREKILASVLERELELISGMLPSPELRFPSETLGDEIKTLARVMMEEYRERLPFMQRLLVEAIRNPDVGQLVYRTFVVQGRLLFTEFLKVRRDRGEVREEVDIEVAAAAYLAAVIGIMLTVEHFQGKKVEQFDEERVIRELADVFMRGVGR